MRYTITAHTRKGGNARIAKVAELRFAREVAICAASNSYSNFNTITITDEFDKIEVDSYQCSDPQE